MPLHRAHLRPVPLRLGRTIPLPLGHPRRVSAAAAPLVLRVGPPAPLTPRVRAPDRASTARGSDALLPYYALLCQSSIGQKKSDKKESRVAAASMASFGSLGTIHVPRCPVIYNGINWGEFAFHMEIHMGGQQLWCYLTGERPCPRTPALPLRPPMRLMQMTQSRSLSLRRPVPRLSCSQAWRLTSPCPSVVSPSPT